MIGTDTTPAVVRGVLAHQAANAAQRCDEQRRRAQRQITFTPDGVAHYYPETDTLVPASEDR